MLVIEGKSGKSLELERILKEKSDQISFAVIDTVKLNPFEINNVDHVYMWYEDIEDLIYAANSEHFRKFDCIVFSVNLVNKDDEILKIKDFEVRSGKKVIVTVQNNLMGEISIYRL